MPSHRSKSTNARLEIGLFGQFSVVLDGTKLVIQGKKGQALLAYLARKQGREVSRETLCGLIWGDRADEQARASLRQALAQLRKSFAGAEFALVTTNTSVSVALDGVAVDTQIFDSALNSRNDEAAILACNGEFLEGFPAVDSEFDRWRETERAALQADFVRCLRRDLAKAEGLGDNTAVAEIALRLLDIDDLQEDASRSLMQARLRQRDFNAALRHYETLRERLQHVLGVRPAPETEALMREIRAARQEPARASVVQVTESMTDRSNRPTLAVLPFRALAPEAGMVGEGVADEIIIELSRSSELSVVSRQSSFHFTSDKTEAGEIGAALGVKFYLSGTVQSAGERVRMTARLDRCSDGATVWAERFDRSSAEFFDVQTEIARIVTATVAGRIEASEVQLAQLQRPGNLVAYDHVLRGLQKFHRHVQEDMEVARMDFRAATQLDPNYARAFGLLAMADIYAQWMFGTDGDARSALDTAQTAVRLDEREIKGHCALGIINMLENDFGRARRHFETALAFNNNDDLLLLEHGRFLMYDDHPEEGIASAREAMRLNPFHPNWYWNIIGRCLHSMGQFDEAIGMLEKISSPNFWTLMYLAGCQAKIGNAAKADHLRGQVLEQRPNLQLEALRKLFPYRNAETKARLFDSFQAAGFV